MLTRALLILFLLPYFIVAQAFPSKPINYITDETNVLTAQQQQSLNAKLFDFEKKTSNQIFVYIDSSLNGSDMSTLCQNIFHTWKIGGETKNNGLLIAVFVSDQKFRIHTGYGLEGVLPDILTKRIQDNDMRPFFKENDYYTGIDKGVDQLIYYSQNEFKPDEVESIRSNWVSWLLGYSANLILLTVYLYLLLRKKAKKRSSLVKNRLLILAVILALVPCIGAIILFFMLVFLKEIKSSGGGSSDTSSGSFWSSSDSSSSSSSDSGSSFDGGGGGDSGGGGSSSDW
jgi:uncharacterized protein